MSFGDQRVATLSVELLEASFTTTHRFPAPIFCRSPPPGEQRAVPLRRYVSSLPRALACFASRERTVFGPRLQHMDCHPRRPCPFDVHRAPTSAFDQACRAGSSRPRRRQREPVALRRGPVLGAHRAPRRRLVGKNHLRPFGNQPRRGSRACRPPASACGRRTHPGSPRPATTSSPSPTGCNDTASRKPDSVSSVNMTRSPPGRCAHLLDRRGDGDAPCANHGGPGRRWRGRCRGMRIPSG